MTILSYKLANGSIVSSLTEAKASGLAYETIFEEDRLREEVIPRIPTEEEIEKREERINKIMAKYGILD